MVTDNDRQTLQDEVQAQSWPDLFGKLIMDFTKVLEAEARLVRASIEPTLTSVLEHWLLQLVIASIALLGCLLLVAAVILLLHLWLALWLSFAITGAVTLLLALCGLLIR
jgi:membrane-bound ClpP family serine protease